MAVVALAALLAPIVTAYYSRQIARLIQAHKRLERKVGTLPCVLKPKGGGR